MRAQPKDFATRSKTENKMKKDKHSKEYCLFV